MFHRPVKKEISEALSKPKPKPRPRPPPPKPKAESEQQEQEWKPSGQFQEFKILSTGTSPWKYDIMKFDVRGKDVDPTKWQQPVKLNRKALRPVEVEGEPVPVELKPMLGPDGKPVIGPDGKMVMVGPDGKVPQPGGATVKTNGKDAAKGKGRGKMPFKKKTKQVFLVSEAERQLRWEERYPWVMEEDGSNGQVWVGQLDVDRSQTHGLLVPIGADFMFIPAHRWYKFHKKPSYRILALEEAEAEYAKTQKNKDPERWLMRKRNGAGPSEATLATLKREKSASTIKYEDEEMGSSLHTVDKGGDLFGDDDDEEGKMNKKRNEKYDMDGDMDEMEYEEDVSDDEEKEDADGDDEEARELEERIKREYRQANKTRDGHVDEDDEEEEIDHLTGAGKDLKKLVKRTEKNEAYESDDDEKNPYVSDEEEEPEETPQPVQEGPAVMNQTPTPSQPGSGAATPTSRPQTPRPGQPKPASNNNNNKSLQPPNGIPSRATSPGLGNAVVAKRATSPKAPKPKPIPGSGSRPGSPLASRASSPVPPASSGGPSASQQSLKRKATDDAPTPGASSPGDQPAQKKTKIKAKRPPLEESMVIEWLKKNTEASTRECIQKFQPYLKSEEAKKAFTDMVRRIAVVKNNQMKLKPEYL